MRWIAGFLFGVALAYSLFLIGLISVLIAGLTLVLALVGRWRLAWVSGWFVGIGAMLLWLMTRVLGYCAADPTCVTSSGTTLFIAVSLGFLLVGLITGIAAWRIRRRSAEASA